jgi:hypothetical protein
MGQCSQKAFLAGSTPSTPKRPSWERRCSIGSGRACERLRQGMRLTQTTARVHAAELPEAGETPALPVSPKRPSWERRCSIGSGRMSQRLRQGMKPTQTTARVHTAEFPEAGETPALPVPYKHPSQYSLAHAILQSFHEAWLPIPQAPSNNHPRHFVIDNKPPISILPRHETEQLIFG